MPKKKGHRKIINPDFTINDCANAPKPVSRVKKSAPAEAVPPELPWDRIQDEDFDIVEEILEDGCKTFVYRRKKQVHKPEDNIDTRPGIEYPEIVWYLISHYIKPEEVGHFAGINKATYAITKRESFWRTLYKRYCQNHPKLPERLRIENSYMAYGLQQRVIRALYHTYDVFINKVSSQQLHDYKPHALLKRRCVNVWYRKAPCYWIVYFKLKRTYGCPRETEAVDFIEELGRIDANPEEDSQVLQVICQNFHEVPPMMGMMLSFVSVSLTQGFHYHQLHLGFSTSRVVTRHHIPEVSAVLDTVISILVFDWWHPKYPHFDNRLPTHVQDDESTPVLKKDFFT